MLEQRFEEPVAAALVDFEDRAARGENPAYRDYAGSLGDAFDSFVRIMEARALIADLIEPDEELDFSLPCGFGPYVLHEAIGRGATGVVYRAALGNRVCALKVLRPLVDANPEAIERFRREASICAALEHENVVRVRGADRIGDRLYYEMDLVEGPSLKHLLDSGAALDPHDVARGLAGVAAALAALHAAGGIHRDVKPSNIVVAPDGRYVLADFGLARSEAFATLTRSSQLLGTPLYMSPEQVTGAHGVDARTDVWGLGATLYEAVAGRPPFLAAHMGAVSEAILGRRPAPPSRFRATVPAAIDRIALKALEKRPEDRYASADALRDDLLAFADGGRPAGRPVSGARRALRFVGRRRLPLGFGVLAIVATVAFYARRPATITVRATPAATVFVNDAAGALSPHTARLWPGDVSVRLERKGFRPQTLAFHLDPGADYDLERTLVPVSFDDVDAMRAFCDAVGVDFRAFRHGGTRGRGAARAALPAGRVRVADLRRVRFEVYDAAAVPATGTFRFAIGGQEIARVPARLADMTVEASVPDIVRATAVPGDAITWGYYADGGASWTATCEVVDDPALPALPDAPAVLGDYVRALALLEAGLAAAALDIARGPSAEHFLLTGVASDALAALDLADSRLAVPVASRIQAWPAARRSAWLRDG